MTDIEIAHVKFKQASKGLSVIDKTQTEPFYTFQKGSSMTAIATLAYCPDCSLTHEYDKRFGKVVPKWAMDSNDYQFNLAYKQDENGEWFAECLQCGLDLRTEHDQDAMLEAYVKKPVMKEVYINGVYYQAGHYWMDIDDFKINMKKVRGGAKIKVCFVHKNGDVKRLKNEAFSNAKGLQMAEGKIGIKANLWE